MSVKRITGQADVIAEFHWQNCDDGTPKRVIDAYRVQHRDGSVEIAMSPEEALHMIVALDDRARRKAERKNPAAECIWITKITWQDCGVGFEPPAMEIKS